jgi:Icc-related predicted phosphoesterase
VKLLVFSDIHANVRAASNLVQRSANVDVVVGAGDYGMPRQDLREIISALRQIKKPTVLVSGNCETTEALKDAIIVKNPLLVICGHIHASAGQIDRFGETPIINAGPRGIIWDLVDNMEVKL